MKEFKVRGDISKKSLEEAFREWNKIRSKYVRFMSFFSAYHFNFMYYLFSNLVFLSGSSLFFFIIGRIYSFLGTFNLHYHTKMEYTNSSKNAKEKNPDRDSCGRTFTIRESYLYSEWDEEAPEEKELGQILRVEPVKNHLIIFAGFFESTSENNSRVRLKRYLCIVQKDAFVEGTAKELYDYLRENYPQMKFGPWRD